MTGPAPGIVYDHGTVNFKKERLLEEKNTK